MNTAKAADAFPAVATIVTCVSWDTVAGAVYVAPVAVWLESFPFGVPNPACRLQVTLDDSDVETVTLIDWP
jgi:hypothetical protein